MENTAVPRARGEQLLQQVQREHVVSEEWSQSSAVQCRLGVARCHAPCSNLARVETIWVMVTDSTVDSGSTSSRLPKQIARSHGHGLLADGLGQHGDRQVHGGHLVGERDDAGWAASLAPQQTD